MELTIIAKLLSLVLLILFIVFAMNPSPRLGKSAAYVAYGTIIVALLTPIYLKFALIFTIVYFIYDFVYPRSSRFFEIVSIGSFVAYIWFPKLTELFNTNLDVFYSYFS